MDIRQLAQTRHTCKAFDPERRIPAEQIAQLRAVLRNAPSSVNSQPWHFIIADNTTGRTRIARAMQPAYPYNEQKVLKASHVFVLCRRTNLDTGHLEALLSQEALDGRLTTPEARAAQGSTRSHYVALHRDERKDLHHWMEKQVFIALGGLLLGAAALGIDACPMEGFDASLLDRELDLAERGLASVIVVALGYRSADDFNARQAKSRLPEAAIFSEI